MLFSLPSVSMEENQPSSRENLPNNPAIFSNPKYKIIIGLSWSIPNSINNNNNKDNNNNYYYNNSNSNSNSNNNSNSKTNSNYD